MLESLLVRGGVDSCLLAPERCLPVSDNSGSRREKSSGDSNGGENRRSVTVRSGYKSADKSIHVCPFEKPIALVGAIGEVRQLAMSVPSAYHRIVRVQSAIQIADPKRTMSWELTESVLFIACSFRGVSL